MRSEIDVLTPKTIDEALELRREHQDAKIIAGGSDLIVQLRDGAIKTSQLLDISSLKELRFIREDQDKIQIGSLTTYNEIINSPIIRKHAWILAESARQIGATQLQNTATIGGNLGNASPAADSIPPLYALDTTIITRSVAGRREIPIDQFYLGYRKIALLSDELIEQLYFKPLRVNDAGAYLKLGLRGANAISLVDVAVALRERNVTSFSKARVALGAVAPTVRYALKCEKILQARPLDREIFREAGAVAAQDATPIDDIRASAEYRRNIVSSLVYQALCIAVLGE
jgi:CO/xanthine dehydrogenase FAD-binding subunit